MQLLLQALQDGGRLIMTLLGIVCQALDRHHLAERLEEAGQVFYGRLGIRLDVLVGLAAELGRRSKAASLVLDNLARGLDLHRGRSEARRS